MLAVPGRRHPRTPVADRHGRAHWLVAALAVSSLVGVRAAHADDVAAQLASYEAEARQLGAELPRPNQLSSAAGQRRLVDAQVAYALGDYDTAAVALFELAARPGPDQEVATFYL